MRPSNVSPVFVVPQLNGSPSGGESHVDMKAPKEGNNLKMEVHTVQVPEYIKKSTEIMTRWPFGTTLFGASGWPPISPKRNSNFRLSLSSSSSLLDGELLPKMNVSDRSIWYSSVGGTEIIPWKPNSNLMALPIHLVSSHCVRRWVIAAFDFANFAWIQLT